MESIEKPLIQRPLIGEYSDPAEFVRDMIAYRKKSERSFSVMNATQELRKVSPALISLIVAHKRKITLDRVDELSRLLKLVSSERIYFKEWISRLQHPHTIPELPSLPKNRKEVSTHILNDWVNVYVKDCFQIPAVQKNPTLLYEKLETIASPKRIDKAIEFLLREGHLRKTIDGRIVVEVDLAVADPQLPSQKIRDFHKAALTIAKQAIDLFGTQERFANTLVIPLNEKSYQELLELTQEFATRLQDFAANRAPTGESLYQVTVHLSPTGRKST